ncbi:DNA polymerase alpha catalytic subunit isoform X1, partial [Tachysurus ichikawai]
MAPVSNPEKDTADCDDGTTCGLAASRSRREKKEKVGRKSALEQIKRAKRGEKVKYEVEEMEKVYEEVDEDQYSRMVRDRQDNDWIVDDDGAGYVEDGREIFDEDLEDTSLEKSSKNKPGAKGGDVKNAKKASVSKPNSIKSMFMNSNVKKPAEKNVDLSKDDLLGDILEDLHSEKPVLLTPPPVITLKKKRALGSPMNPFSVQTQTLKESPAASAPKPKHAVIRPPSSDLTSEPAPCLHPQKPKMEEPEEVCDSLDFDEVDFDEPMELGAEQQQEEVTVKVETEPEMKPKTEPEDEVLISGMVGGSCWGKMEEDEVDDSPVDVQVDSSQLPMVEGADGETVFRFYWLDAFEDQFNQPGVVYLFGKVWIESAKAHVSCCVAVKNIERTMYFLPRERKVNLVTGEVTDVPVGIMDVYQEFNSLSEKYRIMKFKSK